MYTKKFWKDAAERALSTAAQTLLALILAAGTTTVVAFNWPVLLGTAATAAVVSVLKSLVAGKLVDNTISPASLVEDKGVLK